MYICKYCGKSFESKQKLGGHTTYCKSNPNYEEHICNTENARKYKNILIGIKNETCKFCGKKIGNKGCLVLHEKRCRNNPDFIPTEKQIELSNKPKNKHKPLTDEHKQKIREGLIHWRKNNPELFMNYSRGKSKCCENFKEMLRSKGISFIEEYSPFIPIRLYSLDIAFPDEKIGIEVNGSHHYTPTGELNESTREKQKYFEENGWKIIQIYYKDCYNIDINKFDDIFNLPIRDKHYIEEDIISIHKNKEVKEKNLAEKRKKKIEKKIEMDQSNREMIDDLIYNSGIDFSKCGWSRKAFEYMKLKNPKWKCNQMIFKNIRKYNPGFLKRKDVWKRKGSIF